MKLYIKNLRNIPRNILLSLCTYLTPNINNKPENLSSEDLTQIIISFLNKLLQNKDFDEQELEFKFLSGLSSILKINQEYSNREEWIKNIQLALGKKILNELIPILEIAHYMSWADGDFSAEELELIDAIFSQLKLLRPFKSKIIDFCSNSIPISTLKSDLSQYKKNKQKVRTFLSFAWSIALVDNQLDEKEYTAYNILSDILEVSPFERTKIMQEIEQKWQKTKSKSVNTVTLAINISEVSSYITKISGLDAFQNLNQFDQNSQNDNNKIAKHLFSITLLSKINIIDDPSLNVIDRTILIIALLLSEV